MRSGEALHIKPKESSGWMSFSKGKLTWGLCGQWGKRGLGGSDHSLRPVVGTPGHFHLLRLQLSEDPLGCQDEPARQEVQPLQGPLMPPLRDPSTRPPPLTCMPMTA